MTYKFRWLPGFARVPYAPSPCHMHPVHNCHHIKSCHPPDKQYIKTHHNTEFIIYTCWVVHYFLFVIPKSQGHLGPRCGMVCEYTVSGQFPHQDTSREAALSTPLPSPSLPSFPLQHPSPPLQSPPLHSPPSHPSLPPLCLPAAVQLNAHRVWGWRVELSRPIVSRLSRCGSETMAGSPQ